jgi:hypothetical protein
MVCHGELVRLKPPVHRLTAFYLTMSLGGALGGVFVAIVAPVVFTTFAEYYIGVFGAGLLAWMCGSLDAIKSLAKLYKGGKTGKSKWALDKRKMPILKKQMYATVFRMLGGLVLISMFFCIPASLKGFFSNKAEIFMEL